MNFPISNSRMSPFLILGVMGGIFHFYLNSNRTFCEQTVETRQALKYSSTKKEGYKFGKSSEK